MRSRKSAVAARRTTVRGRSPAAALLLLTFTLAGCDWLALAANAATYADATGRTAQNIVVIGERAYVAAGSAGVLVVNARTGVLLDSLAPAAPAESVDDVATDGRTIYLLDARAPGFLAAARVDSTGALSYDGAWHPVPVGPFSGVAAAAGTCVVSGGTFELTVWRCDARPAGPTARADLGRGQPDVALSRDARRAYVATHYYGPRFGLDVVSLAEPGAPRRVATLPIEGAGFTTGGSHPANFPIVPAPLDDSTAVVAHAAGLSVVRAGAREARIVATVRFDAPAVALAASGDSVAVLLTGARARVVLVRVVGDMPRIVAERPLPPGTEPAAVAFSATTILVAAREQGVLVLAR